jgi:hypothetical protein
MAFVYAATSFGSANDDAITDGITRSFMLITASRRIRDCAGMGKAVVCPTCDLVLHGTSYGQTKPTKLTEYAGQPSRSESDTFSGMFRALMQSAPAAQHQRRDAATTLTPDYAALVEVLTGLYTIPDGLGEPILTPQRLPPFAAVGSRRVPV